MRLSDDAKLMLGGLFGLASGIYFLWIVIDGYTRGEAMNFSRYNNQWFTQNERPTDFVVSLLLHINLSLLFITASAAALAKYFVLWPPPRVPLAVFAGYAGAVIVLFFACYSIFVIVGLPLLAVVGIPVAWAISHLLPEHLLEGLLPSAATKQRFMVLVHIGGFVGWWLILALLANWALRRKELE